MLAYVLIALKEGKEEVVLDKLSSMKEVKDSHILFGEWDIIAKIESSSPEALADFVMKNIRSMPEVRLTSTLIVAK